MIATGIVLCSVTVALGVGCVLYSLIGLLIDYVGNGPSATKHYMEAVKHERVMDEEAATAIQRAFTVARHGG